MRFPSSFIAVALTLAPLAASAQSATTPSPSAEAELLAADQRRHEAVKAGDGAAVRALIHPSLLVNGPRGVIISGDQLVADVGSSRIATMRFERTVDRARITGDVGVVMGHEIVVPTADSQEGKIFGARELHRRYTSVYLREGGRWLLIARHANVIPDDPKAGR